MICNSDRRFRPADDAPGNADYKAMVERFNTTPRYMPGAEFRKMFEEDSARNAAALRKAGFAK